MTYPIIPAEMATVIQDVTIIDVENGISAPGRTVVIIGDRISQIGTQSTTEVPQGARIIDGGGLTLIPGLVDSHVHYLDAPVFGRLMIANGVLLVRDMGMPNEYILNLRGELNQGKILGPEMVATGTMLDREPPMIPSISLGVRTPEEGRRAVRGQAAAGVDMIKVYHGLDKEVFLAIVDEAQNFGLKVVGHVPDAVYLEEAVAAGLRTCEHWFGFEKVIAALVGDPVNLTLSGMGSQAGYLQRLPEVDPQALREVFLRLKNMGMVVDPTIVTFKNFPDIDALEPGGTPWGEYIPPNILSMWKSLWSGQSAIPEYIWRNWAQMVREMNRLGIPLMVGTDLMVPGIVPGFSVHEEMVIWQEAGIPAADVLRSATSVPAKFMGLWHSLGSIVEGKTASMVLLRGDPLEDIRNTEQIEGVFLRGRYFSRQELDRLLEEAKEMARPPVA